MPFRILADLVVGLHFVFVVFVVVGGLLALRWRRVMWLHIPAAIWGALIEFGGWICPLTPLEKWLRARAGGAGYEGGFIEHYVIPVLYPGALTRGMQFALGAVVVAINLSVYAYVLRRPPIRSLGRDS
ncbi:MAG: DUF2784 domain-containing protein [Gemmatimonadales bacterium]|nr:DUF2784 domain-containing protein [Gemmatimonadales bacterium]